MKSKIVLIGIAIILVAIPSYTIVPSGITHAMTKLTGGDTTSSLNNQIFSQLGIPPIDTIAKFIQYSFIGLIVAGLGITVFGAISKKIPKQPPVRLSIESVQRLEDDKEEKDANSKAVHLLQERLAKGEITSSQYQNLLKLLEDKN